MKKFWIFFSVLALGLVFSSSAWAQAQATTGVIQGTVTDPSGAVVPGATVEARNLDTNFTRTQDTDTNGRFVFLQLPSGRYKVTISKQGFATMVQENLELLVGQAITLPVTMKISAVAETVTVTATPLVDSVRTEASTTLNQVTVGTTPILGRKFEDLLTLTPGVSIVQGPDGDEISFAGQRGIFNNVSLDGGDYNNGFFGEQMGGQRAAIDITLEAVKEFQVVATGASAEFGRTAGGVVNVITKSGTNEVHGSLFHFQRLEALSADTSDGKPLTDFHREQFGGTVGGPLIRDKMFLFGAFEQIIGDLTRTNLGEQVGPTACPVSAPAIPANEAVINTNTDCQRLALINFYKTRLGQEEGLPVKHPIRNTALLARWDWSMTPANQLSFSYNFDRSKNENQTFDVATYGNSANGTEGPSHIQAYNANFFSTLSPTKLNEAHFTYSRESRPRSATPSKVPADTAMGFVTTFRFGNPFFLGPNVDELFWRTHVSDKFSIISGRHTVKVGGEWVHSRNAQVFRGFFLGRYIFSDVVGFLRYASPASLGRGFGPDTGACDNGAYTDLNSPNCGTGKLTGSPLLLFLQGAGRTGPATDAAGASDFSNEEFALFAQDKWQIRPNFSLNYGLRWEAQIFADPFVPPSQTAYAQFLGKPFFPSDGTEHSQKKMFQPRVGFAWDLSNNGKSVLRASWGIYNARQNMLTQVGPLTTNGVQQQTIAGGAFANPTVRPTYPGLAPIPPVAPGAFPLFTGVRIFSSDYANPRIYTTNVAYEQEIYRDWAMYLDFTWAKGVHLTRFVNIGNGGPPVVVPKEGATVTYSGPSPFGLALGETMLTSSSAKSLYRGFTAGMRKKFSKGYQLEWNYVLSKDMDDDSNERDPFIDRSFNRFDFSKDYAESDRDIRHKFNIYTYAELPGGFQANVRIQARSAQPITPSPRILDGKDRGRNTLRKNNEFFSLDWRLLRPFKIRERYAITPMVEMFNTFNNDNNVNPLISPGLFNFDGFLRQGVGDPLQVQLAVRFTF